MSININLADQRNLNDGDKERIKKLKGISYGVLVLTALLAIIIFAIDYRFSASFVKKQQAEMLSSLSSQSDVSAKIFILNKKLSEISNILSERNNYGEVLTQIMGNVDPDISVEDFIYNENGISMTISSPSLTSIDGFLNSTLELVNKKVINKVVMKSLTFESGKYVVELSIL